MLRKIRMCGYTATFILYMLSVPFPYTYIKFALAILSFVCILISLLSMRRTMLFISILFLLLGGLITVSEGKSLIGQLYQFCNMVNLLTVIGLVTLLTIPVKVSGYLDYIEVLTREKVKKPSQFYFMSQTLAYGTGSVMHMASMPMTHTLIKESSRNMNIPNKVMAHSLIQGYSLSMLLSPLGIGFTQVVDTTKATFFETFFFCLALSLLGLAIGRLLDTNELKKIPFQSYTFSDNKMRYKRIFSLIIPLAIFIVGIVLLNEWLHWGFIYLISILIFPFSFLWSTAIKKTKVYFRQVSNHFQNGIPGMFNMFGLLLSAGFFVGILESSTIFQKMINGLKLYVNYINPSVFVILFMLIIIILSVISMHPLVAFTIVLHIVDPATIGIPAFLWGGALLSAMVIGMAVSPFSGTTALMANLVNTSPMQVAKWSAPFGTGFFILVSLVVIIIANFFL